MEHITPHKVDEDGKRHAQSKPVLNYIEGSRRCGKTHKPFKCQVCSMPLGMTDRGLWEMDRDNRIKSVVCMGCEGKDKQSVDQYFQEFLDSGFEITTHGGNPNFKGPQQVVGCYSTFYRWSKDEPWIKSEFRSQHKLREWAYEQFRLKKISDIVSAISSIQDIPKQVKIFVSPDFAYEFIEVLDWPNVTISEFVPDKNEKGEWIYLVADPEAMKKQEDEFQEVFNTPVSCPVRTPES